MKSEFVICLNCVDGRVQQPVLDWARTRGYPYPDLITEPGMDGLLADGERDIRPLLEKVRLLVRIHGCDEVAVFGHTDCAGNPASDEDHKRAIMAAARRLSGELPGMDVVGLWIGPDWVARQIYPEGV